MTLAAASVISKIEYYTWEFMLYRVTREHTSELNLFTWNDNIQSFGS
jgi:hypothetical protein